MVKGYKYINIKEEVIEKIRNLEGNKEEIEQNRFNLAGFVTKVLLEYMDKEEKEKKELLLLGEGMERLTKAVKETFDQREKNKGNVTTADTNLTKEDLKEALLGLENDIDMKIRDMLNGVMNKL